MLISLPSSGTASFLAMRALRDETVSVAVGVCDRRVKARWLVGWGDGGRTLEFECKDVE